MAERAKAFDLLEGKLQIVSWQGLLPGDTGAPVDISRYTNKYLWVTGNFDGETVAIQVSNNGGVSWASIGTFIVRQSGKVFGTSMSIADDDALHKANADGNILLRPVVSNEGSEQSTNLQVHLVAAIG